jgi:hypothetical protein
MAQPKNAKREHYVAPWDAENPNEIPKPADFHLLGAGITSIEDDTDENTDDYSDYAGDGSTASTLTGYGEKWNFSGRNVTDDPAQTLIRKMKRKPTDDERRLWLAIRFTDGTAVVGVAKAMEIKAGSGDSSDYEEFSGHLDYDGVPQPATITGDKKTGLTAVALGDTPPEKPAAPANAQSTAHVGGATLKAE